MITKCCLRVNSCQLANTSFVKIHYTSTYREEVLILQTNNYIKVIKEYRKSRSLSQEALGKRLGYDKSHISHIENGSREITIDFLVNFSRESNLSIDYILGFETTKGVQCNVDEYTKRVMALSPKDRQLLFQIIEPLINRLEKNTNR